MASSATTAKPARSFRIVRAIDSTSAVVSITASRKTAEYAVSLLESARQMCITEVAPLAATYTVRDLSGGPVCNCKGFQSRRVCKHAAILAPLTAALRMTKPCQN